MYQQQRTTPRISKNNIAGLILIATMLVTKLAFGAEILIKDGECKGEVLTGREAVEALIKDPKTKIISYSEIELSEKTGKIKNKSNR